MFRDVTRERARSVTRVGQIGAVALGSLVGVVFATGIPGMGVPKFEAPAPPEPMKAPEPVGMMDMPAIMEKRAESIARNLAQLRNAPKIPAEVPVPEGSDDTHAGDTAPAPAPTDLTVLFLGQLGSGARPMALISIDSHQQVLAVGDTVRKASGEAVKLVAVNKTEIEIEVKGAIKKVELAPRSGPAFTSLQATPTPVANAGIVPGATPPGNPANNAARSNREFRTPGMRPPRPPRSEDAGGMSRE